MSQRQRTLSAALLVLLLTGGCDGRRELHIAMVPWIGYETFTLARDFDWLPGGVVLHRKPAGNQVLEAFRDGEVDAATMSLEEALRLGQTMTSLRVVLVMDESAGADLLLARPDVATLAELAQRPVAYEGFGVTMLLLNGALRSAGLGPAEVQRVELTVDRHLEAYRSGAIDAAASYMPYAQDLIDEGAVTLFDSRSLPGAIVDVLVVNNERMQGRRALMREVIAAHFRALEHLRRNREDAVYRIAGYQDQPAMTVRRALSGVRLPGVEAVRAQLAADSTLQGTIEQLVDTGAIDSAPAVSQLLDGSLLPAPVAQ